MTPELARALERHRQNRNARREQHKSARASRASSASALRGELAAGDRVFDTVTGQEGTIIHATNQNIIHSATNG